MPSTEFDKLKARLLAKKKPEHLPWDKGLSLGATLLNLSVSGRPNVGLLPGYYFLFVGDSNSGKSWMSLNTLAEASINTHYDNHRFVYDGPERGDLMDVAKFFGEGVADRLERVDPSNTVEEFYDRTWEDLRSKKPFIKILDSVDCLTSRAEQKKNRQQRNARSKGEEERGSFGMDKARVNSDQLRQIIGPLDKTGSILIIINQAKDNVGAKFWEPKKRRSGGTSLGYYAQVEIWSSIKAARYVTYKEKRCHVGNLCHFHVKRSRFTGRQRDVDIPIHFNSGIDDVGACVRWLVEWGHWAGDKKNPEKGAIDARELKVRGNFERVVHAAEAAGLERLQGIVGEAWAEIEVACEVKRVKRY